MSPEDPGGRPQIVTQTSLQQGVTQAPIQVHQTGQVQTIQLQQFQPVISAPGAPQLVYQLLGPPAPTQVAVQPQPTGQFSVLGFQPIFPVGQAQIVQQTAHLAQGAPNLRIGSIQPGYLEAIPVPDFTNLQLLQNSGKQTQISSFFKETKKNVQRIAPKPDSFVDAINTDSYCKQKKKKADSKQSRNRQLKKFNGMSEEEISKKGLPDYLRPGLDVVIIGINPSMHSAWTGNYYDGPGNHFWHCMAMSGLVGDIHLTAGDDRKLLDFGIGFTNVVARTTRGLSDLSKQELSDGAKSLREKLMYWRPKVAVFNGKIIYEIFTKQKKFLYGLQPDNIPGTEIVQWVMPSFSARCALLPRADDKVPYFQALKKYVDYLNEKSIKPDDSEVTFHNINLNRVSPKKVKEEYVLTQHPNMESNPSIAPESPTSDSSSHDEEYIPPPKLEPVHEVESQMPTLEPEVPWPIQQNSPQKTNSDFEKISKIAAKTNSSLINQIPKTILKGQMSPKQQCKDNMTNLDNNNLLNDKPDGEMYNTRCDEIISCLKKRIETDDSDLELFQSTDISHNHIVMLSPDILCNSVNYDVVKNHAAIARRERTKRPVHESWEGSPPKRNKGLSSPIGVQCVAPWGETLPSFDLSDDYVNDYLKEKALNTKVKTKPEENIDDLKMTPPGGGGLLMISPRPTAERRTSRSGSMDVIPACLPESVGAEIGDILSGFTLEDKDYSLDSELSTELQAQTGVSPVMRSNRAKRKKGNKRSSSGRSSPNKSFTGLKDKSKNNRKKSTEDLPPNMLPEDYLDEVIGQYFNNDSSSEEEPKPSTKSPKKGPVPLISADSEETSEEDEQTSKARTRPPASFFSMDFLDDADLSDLDNIDKTEPSVTEKVKTDLEIEAEYRHILYGGKRRKTPKIGIGKKRKKRILRNNSPSVKLKGVQIKQEKEDKSNKGKKINIKPKVSSPESDNKIVKKSNIKLNPPYRRNVKRIPNPEPVGTPTKSKQINKQKEKSKTKSPQPLPLQSKKQEDKVIKMLSWKGKKANPRACDRSERSNIVSNEHKPFTSAKIVDVTGKYGEEEELVTCGICELLDPPFDPENPLSVEDEVEWMGCDCYRWFHKCCTRLMKFTEKFSCKSVKMRCLDPSELVISKEPVLQIAILKFIRDRDTTFIDDLLDKT